MCVWTRDEIDDSYDTTCGNKFTLSEGTWQDNELVFCPFCGEELE